MIDWSSIKPLAKGIIRDLSGCQVVYENEPEGGTWNQEPVIYLRIAALGQDGTAWESREDSLNVSDDAVVTVSTQKHFTLSLRCESFDQDLASGKHGGDILESVKTRLKRTSTIERLRGVFCVQQLLGSNWFNYKNQGRQVSCYTLDLLCATVDNDVDQAVGAGGFIEEVKVASEFLNADPNGPQVDLDVTGGA